MVVAVQPPQMKRSPAGDPRRPGAGFDEWVIEANPCEALSDNAAVPTDLLRSAALIEGLRLDDALPIGALVVEPVPHEGGFAGRELRQTFNDLLAAHGFVSTFDRPGGAMQLAPRRRLAFVATPPVEVEQIVPASLEASRDLGRLVGR